MVKFYESNFTYDYSFPAVSLAYFLRYPNPYSTHVLSTDTISRYIDSAGRLHTTRIHLKRSRLPSAVLRLLPKSVKGNVEDGKSSSYILEESCVDIKEGWMKTSSRNLDWTGILSVIERQEFRRDPNAPAYTEDPANLPTGVTTTITFRSRLGDKISEKMAARREARKARLDEKASMQDDDDEPSIEAEHKKGFLASWSTAGIQRSIEAIASKRTIQNQGKSREGMKIVLNRLRNGGLMGVLEGMRQDRESFMHTDGIMQRVVQDDE